VEVFGVPPMWGLEQGPSHKESIKTLGIIRDGSVWFGTYFSVLRFDGNKWTTFTTDDGLFDNDVTRIIMAKDGSMWFGTPYGVSRYKAEEGQ
jgi:ligand-binding sensor domain-containing protein